MFQKMQNVLLRTLLTLALIVLVTANARPPQFSEGNQVPDQENNLLESGGLKPWQIEMLAQRLNEYNQAAAPVDFGWERPLRNPEIMKRQSRYRQCYFNPISCFRK